MTRIEEADQDLYADAVYVICDLSYCELALRGYNADKQEKSLTTEQRFDDIKQIGKLVDKTFDEAANVVQLIRIRKADELQERRGFFCAMMSLIYDLVDRIDWQMYGDLSEPYDDRISTFTSDNENTEKEN